MVSVFLASFLLIWVILEVFLVLIFVTILIVFVVVTHDIILVDFFVALLHDEVCDGVKDFVAEVLGNQLRNKVVVFFLLDVVHSIHEVLDHLFFLGRWLSIVDASHSLCGLVLPWLSLQGLTLSQ